MVLAIAAGAARRYLEVEAELPDKPLIAQVPVSLRTGDQEQSIGTQVATLFCSLATDVDDVEGARRHPWPGVVPGRSAPRAQRGPRGELDRHVAPGAHRRRTPLERRRPRRPHATAVEHGAVERRRSPVRAVLRGRSTPCTRWAR
ncbi:MAG: hypothetical protein R2695_20975 [Acidimicrobiales bacterium]